MSTFSYFTNPQALHSFKKDKLIDKENFVALYKVYGKERIDTHFEEVMVVTF